MALQLHTKSRDNLYCATADYTEGKIVVKENSKINMAQNAGFNPSSEVAMKRNDRQLVSTEGILLNDVSFSTLSAAASFVTGRIANGYMVWKTEDNKYVRFTLKSDEKNE